MSEAVYLRKPMLALPLAGQFEQEMNARYLERCGYGTGRETSTRPALERFLEREPLSRRGARRLRAGRQLDVALELVDRTRR